MNEEMPVLLFALIRNGLAMGQYYHRARRENRKPAMTPPSRHAVPSANLSLQWLPCKEFVNNGGRIDRLGQIDHVSVMGEQ